MSSQVVVQCPVASCRGGQTTGCTIYLKCKDAKPVFCYRNIPYAKPPTGSLRFLPPQPADPWDGIRDGTVFGKLPMQDLQSPKLEEPYFPQKRSPGDDDDMDEDCLHLAVYTNSIDKKNMPVMIWIYGGSFQDGSERLYDGSALAGLHDVVVVIPNYRLNIFGFLSLGKGSVCPGNAGLLDQNLAMKWVQENIEHFGGDPGNVTIFGESAGAMSVNHHMNSLVSRGLFQRAISHSGQSEAPFFFARETASSVEAILHELNIRERDPSRILKALQGIPSKRLKQANDAVVQRSGWTTLFLPCVDGFFLSKSPRKSLEDGDFASVPYIIGCNSSECYGALAMCRFGDDLINGITEKQFKEGTLIPVNDEDLKKLMDFYVKDKQDPLSISKLYCHVTGDSIFVAPAVSTASVMSESNDVYFYQCCYQPRFSHDENFGPKAGMKVPWCICDHGDDVYMMLGVPFTPGNLRLGGRFSKEEEDLCRKCMLYITNFAKHGDPNIGKEVPVKWPKYGTSRLNIVLDHEVGVHSNLAARRVEYWKDYWKRKNRHVIY